MGTATLGGVALLGAYRVLIWKLRREFGKRRRKYRGREIPSRLYVMALMLAGILGAILHPLRLLGGHAWVLRILGAKVGKGVVIANTAVFPDPWMVTIGDEVVVGELANVCAHALTRDDVFRVAPVTLEDGAVIGSHAVVPPGATVACGALVPIGAVVGFYQKWEAR